MIIFVIIAILIGSFSTSILLALRGASWGLIALGYVLGGWGGLILGGGLLMLTCRFSRTRPGLRTARLGDDRRR